jgi:hypothetical protein
VPHDMMLKCERKAPFKINNEKVWRWVEVDVAALPSGEQPKIRCIHCHGQVRVHKRNVAHGPQDHVEHMSHQDSETAGEVIISRASIRCLSSRFPDWRSQRHVRVVSQAVCRLIVTAIM